MREPRAELSRLTSFPGSISQTPGLASLGPSFLYAPSAMIYHTFSHIQLSWGVSPRPPGLASLECLRRHLYEKEQYSQLSKLNVTFPFSEYSSFECSSHTKALRRHNQSSCYLHVDNCARRVNERSAGELDEQLCCLMNALCL